MQNWEIKSRSRACCSCQAPFETGQVYHCFLDLTVPEPVRSDHCQRCWGEKGLEAGRGREGTAYWKASFRRVSRRREETERIEKDLVQRLLDKHIRSVQERHINLCYILGLLQERKKILIVRQRGRDEEGNLYTVYEHRERGDTFVIRDPGLSLAEAESVEAEIKQLLAEEKTQPAPESGEEDGVPVAEDSMANLETES